MLTLTQPNPSPLSKEDAHLAEVSSFTLQRLMASYDDGKQNQPIQTTTLRLSVKQPNGEMEELSLPNAALPLLASLLTELGKGNGVSIIANDTEITTQQAADFMNVSRPYVVKLIDEGKIPSRKVGVRRRVRLANILRYMEETGDAASKALDEMVAENQKLGFYP